MLVMGSHPLFEYLSGLQPGIYRVGGLELLVMRDPSINSLEPSVLSLIIKAEGANSVFVDNEEIKFYPLLGPCRVFYSRNYRCFDWTFPELSLVAPDAVIEPNSSALIEIHIPKHHHILSG